MHKSFTCAHDSALCAASGAIVEESEEEAREEMRLPPISASALCGRDSSEGADMSICRDDSPAPSSSCSSSLAAELQVLQAQNAELMSTVAALEQANADMAQSVVSTRLFSLMCVTRIIFRYALLTHCCMQTEVVSHEELAMVINDNNRLRNELDAALAGTTAGGLGSPLEDSEHEEKDNMRVELDRLSEELAFTVAKVCV